MPAVQSDSGSYDSVHSIPLLVVSYLAPDMLITCSIKTLISDDVDFRLVVFFNDSSSLKNIDLTIQLSRYWVQQPYWR
jgi:hypothetical protein